MKLELRVTQLQSILSAISWMQRWIITNINESSCLWNPRPPRKSWPQVAWRLMNQQHKLFGPDATVTMDVPDEIIALLRDFLQYSEEDFLERELQLAFDVDGPSMGSRSLEGFKRSVNFSEWKTPHNTIREIFQNTK